MKILIVHSAMWLNGGAEQVIVRLANWLTDHNHPVTILTTAICDEVRDTIKEARLLPCKNYEEMLYVLKNIYSDFDVINAHNDPSQLLCFGIRKPVVWLCNEPPQKWLEGHPLTEDDLEPVQKFVDVAVVADEFNQKRFKEIYNKDSKIIPYGIDYYFFEDGKPEWIKEKYDLKDKFVLTQVGFISDTKNQLRTLEIFKDVKEKIPEAKLLLVGYDKLPYAGIVRSEIKRLGFEDDVIITGLLPQETIRDIYHASDVVLSPIKAQGGWLSIFEAMATGTPVIVSKEATASSILEKNHIGYVENFVENIVKIHKNGGQLNVSDADWVKDNLAWETFCVRFCGLFEDLK